MMEKGKKIMTIITFLKILEVVDEIYPEYQEN